MAWLIVTFRAINQAAGRTVPGVTFLNTPVCDSPSLTFMGIFTGSLWEITGFKKDPVNFPQSCPYKVREAIVHWGVSTQYTGSDWHNSC